MLIPELSKTPRRNRDLLVIPRYAGSKRRHWPLIVGHGHYDAIIEPFAGGGSLSSRFATTWPAGAVFAADQNGCVRAVWQCWADPGLHEAVYQAMDALIATILAEFSASLDYLGYTMAELSPRPAREAIALKTAVLLPETWPALKAEYEAGLAVGDIADPARLAAVALALHAVTFGGVSRDTPGSEALNISPNYGQLEKLATAKWRYAFPPAPGRISVGRHWEEAIAHLEASSCSQALAIVDPPYWLPYTPGTRRRGTGGMTPAYPGHRPHDPATLAMAVDSARRLAGSDKVRRLVVTNYFSAELDSHLGELASFVGLHIQRLDLGLLAGLNKTRAAVTRARDTAWILSREKPVSYYQEELNLWAS